jgi:hypothetical protein
VSRRTGPSPAVVGVVLERAQYQCEIALCALGDRRVIDWVLHHRRPRRMGGDRRPDTNSPANLLLLCPPHHEEIESRRAESYAAGWLLPQNARPEQVAVLVQRDRWVYLTATGEYSDDPPEVPDAA